jgi:hypothetical protein
MAKHRITIEVESTDPMMAGLVEQGLQNISNELGDIEDYLIPLADVQTAKSFNTKIKSMINNPLFKTLAGKF